MEDSVPEKHFGAQARERRFDPSRRFGCLQGKTAVHKDHLEEEEGMEEMTVERPETEEGVALSAFDMGEVGRDELLTSKPVKQGWAAELSEELQRLCVATTIHRHPENPDFALRCFELPIVGYRREEARAATDSRVPLYAAPAKRGPGVVPPTFATLLTSPPEEVMEKSLMRRARLSWKGCAELPAKKSARARAGAVRPRNAAVNYWTQKQLAQCQPLHLDCWIQDEPESYLEVDLGMECFVTHVSTLGRFPPMEIYPSLEMRRDWKEETGQSWEERWPVVHEGGPGWGQWVTRYELQARLEGGRSWETIGSFKGNQDMTTEVAVGLREACRCPTGLRCRFLRFLPEACHGKPAMRVGVYGSPVEEARAAPEEKKAESFVRYLVPVPLSNRNRRRKVRERQRQGSPDWRGKYGADYPIVRRRRKLEGLTRAEGKEALGKDRKALVMRQDSLDSEPEVPDVLEQPTLRREVSVRVAEAMAQQPPPLLRTRTDEERGYCSEPEELLAAEWVVV